MQQPFTIDGLDSNAWEWIEKEARRTGLPVDAIVRQLIYRGIEAGGGRQAEGLPRSLSNLAGTWTPEEAEAFLRAISDQSELDLSIWQ